MNLACSLIHERYKFDFQNTSKLTMIVCFRINRDPPVFIFQTTASPGNEACLLVSDEYCLVEMEASLLSLAGGNPLFSTLKFKVLHWSSANSKMLWSIYCKLSNFQKNAGVFSIVKIENVLGVLFELCGSFEMSLFELCSYHCEKNPQFVLQVVAVVPNL